jgi:TrmH family RNA methyltransferase
MREIIRSSSNALVRQFRGLIRGGAGEELILVEGIRLVEEALTAGIEIVTVAVSPRIERSERGRRVVSALNQRGIAMRWVDEKILSSLSELDTSQGVLALARRPQCDERPIFARRPLVLVIAGAQNPGNVGGLLRSAEAAGATGVFLTAGSADPFSWKSLRGAMGSAFRVPCISGGNADDILARLRAQGVVSFATVAEGGTPYDRVDFRRPSAVWLGNEGAGLPEGLVRAVEERITIPMAAPVESLNVAAAGGVLLFEAARQRRGLGQ